MARLARPLAMVSAAGAVALAATFAFAAPASAATSIPVNADCQARPPIGQAQQLNLGTTITGDAPATVAAGASFEATLTPDPLQVPTSAGGSTVNTLKNLSLQIPVPANATYQSATITGGSGLGTGTPTVTEANNVVTVSIPGPVDAGTTITLPVLHLGLAASGAAGSTIDTHLAGTSYDDPGLTFTANVQVSFFTVDVPTFCFANPPVTFTSTQITAAE